MLFTSSTVNSVKLSPPVETKSGAATVNTSVSFISLPLISALISLLEASDVKFIQIYKNRQRFS